MKFRPSDRMLQLGVAPALTALIKELFPGESASLWQRDAKAAHRRMVRALPEVPGTGPLAKQGRSVMSLAALLLGFHEGAPAGVAVDEGAFARMVDCALATPIVHMAFAGARPLSEEGARELSGLLNAGSVSGEAGLWAGTLAREGTEALVCTVARCGLVHLCVSEKRFYLLRHLCKIEAVQAAASGLSLARPSCIAAGDPVCVLRCEPR